MRDIQALSAVLRSARHFLRGTGYGLLLWIEEAVALADFKPPRITIHSANPAAKLRMDAAVMCVNERRKS